MKMNDCIMEEARGLLEYKAPELTELDAGLAFVDGMGIGDDDPAFNASGKEETNVFFADGDDGEENGTFGLDD